MKPLHPRLTLGPKQLHANKGMLYPPKFALGLFGFLQALNPKQDGISLRQIRADLNSILGGSWVVTSRVCK